MTLCGGAWLNHWTRWFDQFYRHHHWKYPYQLVVQYGRIKKQHLILQWSWSTCRRYLHISIMSGFAHISHWIFRALTDSWMSNNPEFRAGSWAALAFRWEEERKLSIASIRTRSQVQEENMRWRDRGTVAMKKEEEGREKQKINSEGERWGWQAFRGKSQWVQLTLLYCVWANSVGLLLAELSPSVSLEQNET